MAVVAQQTPQQQFAEEEHEDEWQEVRAPSAHRSRHALAGSLTLTAPARLQIGVLANKGISATDIKKLKDFGLHTVADIQHTTTKSMLNIKGLSEAKVVKIKEVARGESGNSFMSGLELRQKRENILKARCHSYALLPPSLPLRLAAATHWRKPNRDAELSAARAD
jgi:hypothetical protein